MLYHFLYPLHRISIIFNLFRYITFRAAYAAALSIILVLLFGPWFIKKIKKLALGEKIYEELPERHKREKKGIPSMGGVLILFSMVISILLFADLTNRNVLLSLFVIISLGILGFWDDYMKIKRNNKGLAKRWKFLGQFLVAGVVAVILYLFPEQPSLRSSTNFLFFKNLIVDMGIFYIPFVIFVIVGSANAVNFADGLDGLATGLLVIVAGAFTALSYVTGHAKIADYLNIIYISSAGELAIVNAAALGAGLGFLWYNSYPATIFMGDTGSLPLGGLLGLTAVLIKHEILLGIAGGVFVMEVISVIIQIVGYRCFNKKRVFKMAPLHHHFELKGWKEPKIVVRFWIIGILFALIALSTLKIR